MFYKTQIESVRAGYAIDVTGKRLTFIGNYPCKSGDFVWTDGKVIFGNISNKSQPITFDDNSGIPILANDLRGYFDSNGKFRKFKVADDLLDEELDIKQWFINSKNKVFYDNFDYRQEPFEDMEVGYGNETFAISLYIGSAYNYNHFKIYGTDDDNTSYSITKNFNEFVPDGDDAEIIFLKLLQGDNQNQPVKWFAAIKSTHGEWSTMNVPDTKQIRLIQHTEQEQEISFEQPAIYNCSVEVVEDTVHHRPIDWCETHEEIFTLDSNGNKKVIWVSDSSGAGSTLPQLTNDKVVVDSEGTTTIPANPAAFHVTNFDGTATVSWTGIGIGQAVCEGTWYKIIQEPVDVDFGGGTSSETSYAFTYPVQDGFYISAKNLDSPLKLYDSKNNLILDFANSNDEDLAKLKGFHNFASAKVSGKKYLLTIHDWDTSNFCYADSPLWSIKDGKATKLSTDCYNYRLRKMTNISRARRK